MPKAPTTSDSTKTLGPRKLPLNDPDLQDLIGRCRKIKKPQPAANGALSSSPSSSSSFSSRSDIVSHAASNRSHDSHGKRALHNSTSSSGSDLTSSSHAKMENKEGGMESKLSDLLDKLQRVEKMLVDVKINEEGRGGKATESDKAESVKGCRSSIAETSKDGTREIEGGSGGPGVSKIERLQSQLHEIETVLEKTNHHDGRDVIPA